MATQRKKAVAKAATKVQRKPKAKRGPRDTSKEVSAYLLRRMVTDPRAFTRSLGEFAAQHAHATGTLLRMRPNPTTEPGTGDGTEEGGEQPTTTSSGSYTPPAATAFWWGFNIYIPEDTMVYFQAADSLIEALNEVFGSLIEIPWVGWVIAAVITYIDIEWALMQAVDKGNGVYLSMSWFAIGIFVPTTA